MTLLLATAECYCNCYGYYYYLVACCCYYYYTTRRKYIKMMKIALLLSAIAGASAFAPSQNGRVATNLNAADLSSLRGVGPETGGKVVSSIY